jgi:phage terminase large subunit
MKVNITDKLNPNHREVFTEMAGPTAPVLIFYGGAGAGKSYTMADRVLLTPEFHREPVTALVVRRSMPSIRSTCAAIIEERARYYGLPYDLNQRDMTAQLNRGKVIYKSVNNPSEINKIRSMTNIDVAWIEEADELDEATFDQIMLRLRGGVLRDKQVVLTLNPINTASWVYRRFWEHADANPAIKIHTTWKDNPFDPYFGTRLEALRESNPEAYRIFALGEWGRLGGTVYTNWRVIPALPDGIKGTVVGLDFGFNAPSAAVRIHYTDEPHQVIIEELIYKSGLTNADLIAELRGIVGRDELIIADAAEPARIEEMRRAGLRVREADKAVTSGIDYVKGHELLVLDGSPNLEKELRGYVYAKDKAGGYVDVPVKFNDHLMDAMRYGLFTNRRKGLPQGVGPDGARGIGTLLDTMVQQQRINTIMGTR